MAGTYQLLSGYFPLCRRAHVIPPSHRDSLPPKLHFPLRHVCEVDVQQLVSQEVVLSQVVFQVPSRWTVSRLHVLRGGWMLSQCCPSASSVLAFFSHHELTPDEVAQGHRPFLEAASLGTINIAFANAHVLFLTHRLQPAKSHLLILLRH